MKTKQNIENAEALKMIPIVYILFLPYIFCLSLGVELKGNVTFVILSSLNIVIVIFLNNLLNKIISKK